MSTRRLLALLIAGTFASCADIEPGNPIVEGNVGAVSSTDIAAVMLATKKQLASIGHSQLPIYKLKVINGHQIDVYCAEHYGSAPGSGTGLVLTAERIKTKWHITHVGEFEQERVIVT